MLKILFFSGNQQFMLKHLLERLKSISRILYNKNLTAQIPNLF